MQLALIVSNWVSQSDFGLSSGLTHRRIPKYSVAKWLWILQLWDSYFPKFKSQFFSWPLNLPFYEHLTSFYLNFLTCKTEMAIIPVPWS